jgi:hypothetical protein
MKEEIKMAEIPSEWIFLREDTSSASATITITMYTGDGE